MMQDSAGAVVGALIGSWLLQYDFHFVCWVGAAIFVLAAGWNAWLLPAYRISTVRIPMKEGMLRVLRDRRFHLCPDADRLLHVSGTGDADDADRGQRNRRFTGGGEMDVCD